MATIKKNQLANIVFPIVDGTDFASVESGITASDFESKMTKKFFGVTHGNSTAFTSGTISKAATLVRSGIFQQTLKAAETNYDYVLYSFAPANTSLAHQMLVFQPVDYDDSDIFSQLSDIGSNLLSYLTGMSGMMSDVQSALDSQFLIITSNLSDVESQVDLLASSNYLSQVHSDLTSQIAGIAVTVTASDMSDIASRVWATTEGTRVDSRILVIQSMISDVDSQLLLNASVISDVQSALDSQFTWTSNFLSDMNSDLASQIAGITASVSASDISDIASAVWANTIGARVDSRILLVQSNISDVESQLDVTHSSVSDIYSLLSDVDSQLTVTHSLVSDIDSQLLLNASVISDVQSAVTALNDISVADVLTTQMTEAYAADGTAPTLAQALFLIQQSIGDFSISGTTLTVKKLDGSTAAATYTLDDATDPTSRTRAT